MTTPQPIPGASLGDLTTALRRYNDGDELGAYEVVTSAIAAGRGAGLAMTALLLIRQLIANVNDDVRSDLLDSLDLAARTVELNNTEGDQQ